MRRRVRLTGRRQLPKSAVKVELHEVGGNIVAVLTVPNMEVFKHYDRDANVSIRLIENKRVEVVRFGTIGRLQTSVRLEANDFVAPSCQLRVADSSNGTRGLLLGSTDSWTLRAPDETKDGQGKGIISFLPYDTAPQTWKLDIREDDYPIVKVDRRIANASAWASNDPIFTGAVLPQIVRQIFEAIIRQDVRDDADWVKEWMKWADTLMPGKDPPDDPDDAKARDEYIDVLVDTFCSRHDLADRLLSATQPKGDRS